MAGNVEIHYRIFSEFKVLGKSLYREVGIQILGTVLLLVQFFLVNLDISRRIFLSAHNAADFIVSLNLLRLHKRAGNQFLILLRNGKNGRIFHDGIAFREDGHINNLSGNGSLDFGLLKTLLQLQIIVFKLEDFLISGIILQVKLCLCLTDVDIPKLIVIPVAHVREHGAEILHVVNLVIMLLPDNLVILLADGQFHFRFLDLHFEVLIEAEQQIPFLDIIADHNGNVIRFGIKIELNVRNIGTYRSFLGIDCV